MPPPKSNKQLTAVEIAVLQRWIQQGAEHKLHWSYVNPQRPALPVVQDRNWVRTEIDHFILQRLEKEGLRPAAEADRVTLILHVGAKINLTSHERLVREMNQFQEAKTFGTTSPS